MPKRLCLFDVDGTLTIPRGVIFIIYLGCKTKYD